MTSPLFYPDVAVGDLVTADLLDSMLPKTYVKSTTVGLTSDATLNDDTELSGIELVAGLWEIELTGYFTQASTTPKLKTRWGFTGTWDNSIRACIGPGINQTAAPNTATDVTVAGYQASGQDAVYDVAVSAVFAVFREFVPCMTVTATGNLSFQWSQNTSDANAVSLKLGTAFRIRRLG